MSGLLFQFEFAFELEFQKFKFEFQSASFSSNSSFSKVEFHRILSLNSRSRELARRLRMNVTPERINFQAGESSSSAV